MFNYQAAIFDFDGTLIDSMWLWETLGTKYLENCGVQAEPGLDKHFISMSLNQSAQYLKEHYQLGQSVEQIMQSIDGMITHYYNDIFVLKPGILALLSHLDALGVKMCIATLTNGYLVEAALQRNNIAQYFSRVFSCRDLGISKREPQIYQIAAEHLAVNKSKILVFEDAPHAIQTAKNAGFTVVGVRDNSYQIDGADLSKMADFFVEKGDFLEVLGLSSKQQLDDKG